MQPKIQEHPPALSRTVQVWEPTFRRSALSTIFQFLDVGDYVEFQSLDTVDRSTLDTWAAQVIDVEDGVEEGSEWSITLRYIKKAGVQVDHPDHKFCPRASNGFFVTERRITNVQIWPRRGTGYSAEPGITFKASAMRDEDTTRVCVLANERGTVVEGRNTCCRKEKRCREDVHHM